MPQWRVGDVNVTEAATEAVEQIGDNDIPGLSAEMAYHSTLAAFPFLLFLAGLIAVLETVLGVQNLTDRLVDRLGEVLSGDVTRVVETLIEEIRKSRGLGAVALGLVGALLGGSAVVGTAMKGLNRIYDRKEDRAMVPRKLLAIGLAIVFGGLLVAAVATVAASSLIMSGIGDWIGLGGPVESIVGVLAWPVALGMVVFAVSLLYWLGPAGDTEFHWITIGAAVFGIGWLIASFIFVLYISNISSTTGSLGALIILLVWMYWTNFLVLIGAQINCIVGNVRDSSEPGIKKQPKTTQAQP